MRKQVKRLDFSDRKTVAALYEGGAGAAEIAEKVGVSRAAIYTELKRGHDGVTLDKNLRFAYDPALAQKRVQEGLRKCGKRKGVDQNV